MPNTRTTLGDQETLDGLVSNTLTSLEEDGIRILGKYALSKKTSLQSVNFPNLTEIGEYAMQGCTGLTTVELPASLSTIKANSFNGCTGLVSLILNNTSMVSLADINALASTPIASYNGAVYVPSDLVNTYRANANWSRFFIYSINDYPVDVSTKLPSSWADVNTASENGTYTEYPIGFVLSLTSGSYTMQMQLIAKDTDDLADGSGKAHMTWLSRDGVYARFYNSSKTAVGGYTAMPMYTAVKNLKNNIDSTIQGYMKPVTKTYRVYEAENTYSTLSSSETFWLPSAREVGYSYSYKETSGCTYNKFFPSDDKRIKYVDTSAKSWWTRSCASSNSFVYITAQGKVSSNLVYSSGSSPNTYIVPGFCI